MITFRTLTSGISLVFFGAFLLLPFAVSAASLRFSPAGGNYEISESFSMSVVVESADTAVNAIGATLSFPADKLQVASLSREGSIVGLWAQEPSYSNSAGTVGFDGGILNPGFRGAGGKILSVRFRPIAAGEAKVSFSRAEVLANDGFGTDVLKSLGTASFSISPAAIKEKTKPESEKKEAPQDTEPAAATTTFIPAPAPSPKPIVIEVVTPSVLDFLQDFVRLNIIPLLLAAVLILLGLYWREHRAFFSFRKRTTQSAHRAEEAAEKQFTRLLEKMKNHSRFLNEIRSTKQSRVEEEHFFASLEADIADTQAAVREKISHIAPPLEEAERERKEGE